MPTASLTSLERQLEACLIEIETLQRSCPSLPTAMARAKAGRRIDKLYEQMVTLQEQIDAGPAVSLQDAAVKLRRLGAYVDGPRPMRLLAGALDALERVAAVSS